MLWQAQSRMIDQRRVKTAGSCRWLCPTLITRDQAWYHMIERCFFFHHEFRDSSVFFLSMVVLKCTELNLFFLLFFFFVMKRKQLSGMRLVRRPFLKNMFDLGHVLFAWLLENPWLYSEWWFLSIDYFVHRLMFVRAQDAHSPLLAIWKTLLLEY